jgi:flagella basal body P-ring formation protein FlgA
MNKIIIYFLSVMGYLFAESSHPVKEEIITLIKAELSQHLTGQEFDITLDHWTDSWGSEKEKTLNAKDVTLLQNSSRFQVEIEGFKNSKTKKISGKITYKVSIPVLNRPLQIGEEIGEEDVILQSVSLDDVNQSYYTKKEQLIGLSAKSGTIKPNAPLLKQQLQAPIIVKKGSLIRVTYERKSLRICNKGIALKDAARQDVIPVEISTQDPKQPKKVIQAAIISAQDAKIQL